MRKKKLSGKALVIQLDRDELRIALTTLGSAAPKIQQRMIQPLPQGMVEDGEIRDPDGLRDVLKDALAAPAFKRRKRAVFSICSTQIIPETATVPAVGGRKMEKLLESNMDLYFPVDAREYHLVWKTVGPAGGGEVSVQLWAVPNTLLASYYALANSCGLSVAAIDYCGNSLASAVGADFAAPARARAGRARKERGRRFPGRRAKGEEPKTAVGVLDPPIEREDAPETELYLLAEREYLLMTFVQAGQVKLQRLLLCGNAPESALSEAVMVLEYYGSLDAGRRGSVTGVLCGALAEDPLYRQAADDMLDMPLRVLECEQGPGWCVCLGASRTTLDFGVPAMDQRSGLRRQLAQAWQYGLVLVGGALLAASLLLTFGSRVSRQAALDGLENTARNLELQAAQSAGNYQYYQNYLDYANAYASYSADWENLFGSLRTYNDNLVLAMEELEDILPKTTRVVTLGIAGQGLGLQLACESKEDAAYTIIALRNLQYASLNSISNLSYGGGIDARQVLSSLTGVSEEDLAAALGESLAGSGEAAAEEAPTEGSLDISSLLGLLQQGSDYQSMLQQALAGAGLTAGDLQDALDGLDEDQLEILAGLYGTHEADYDLDELLEEATFTQRQAALRTMLTTDPVAMARFAALLEKDVNGDRELLGVVMLDLLANIDLNTLAAIYSGDTAAMQSALPQVVEILTNSETSLSATEDLIRTDRTLSGLLAYYLAVEMGWQDAGGGSDDIDVDSILSDIASGKLPNTPGGNEAAGILAGILADRVPNVGGLGDQDLEDLFKSYLLGGEEAVETWDVVWTLLGDEDLSPGAEIDPSESAEYSLDDKYYITVTLKYNEELIQAELERKGLSYDSKLAALELEVEP